MRVHTLVVLNLCSEFRTGVLSEDREAAKGLYDKHVSRTDGGAPVDSWLIEVNDTEETGDKASLEPGIDFRVVENGPLPAKIDHADTGVYLVFHAKSSSDPNIFGVRSMGKAVKKDLQARRLVGLLTKLGIAKVRKLSLVACNITNRHSGASKNFLVAVGKEFEKWAPDARPMIAGYDHYVFGSVSGRKYLDAGGQLPMKDSGHKQVLVYKSGLLKRGYERVELELSGWSDKHVIEGDTGIATISGLS